jgi:hypothetical protein
VIEELSLYDKRLHMGVEP